MELSPKILADGFISYLCFLIVLTFHESGHAWMAWKRGDDTARLLGRISLNPLVHIEFVGTVLLPLLGIFLSASGSSASKFVIGWGKPVPVNPLNFKNRRFDNMLVGLAGPFMNIIIAFLVLALANVGMIIKSEMMIEICYRLAVISLFLCFFNLLPVPPLDGSHVLNYLFRMSEETYASIARFGFIIIIIVIQIPAVNYLLAYLTKYSFGLIYSLVNFHRFFA